VLKGQQGLYSHAIPLIEQAISASPRVSAYHNNLGNLWLKGGNPTAAEGSYRRAVKLDRKNADAHLNLGKLLHQKSLLIEARTSILAALRLAPRSLEAHMSLGRVEESMKKLQAALQSYQNASRIHPGFAPAHLAAGNTAKALGSLDAAEQSYRAAISIDPNYTDAYFNLANLLRASQRLPEAVSLYRSAARLSSVGAVDIYNNLGLTLSDLGFEEEALAALLQAVELSPTSDEAWFNLGKQAARTGHLSTAQQHLNRAIELNPQRADAHIELGNLERTSGKLEVAAEHHRAAIHIDPSNASAYNNLGAVLSDQSRHGAALEAYRKAIELRPDFDDAYFNLGKELAISGDQLAAMEMLRKAIAINPKNASAHTQIGTELLACGFIVDAAASFRTSLEIDGTSLITRSNLGLALAALGETEGLDLLEAVVQARPDSPDDHWAWSEKLLLHGRFEQGWHEYEFRLRVDKFVSQHPAFTQPRWTGEPLDGKTILLYAEQGQGDSIQFSRYAKLVADRGGRVLLQVPRSLRRLLEGTPGVAQCIAQGDALPEFSTYAPLMSLPYLCETRAGNFPAPLSPLPPAPAAEPGRKLQVGIVWAGNSRDKRDPIRSTRLAQWSALANLEGVEFTALQVGDAALQKVDSPLNFVQDLDGVKDFADTAAIVQKLDLVITVDTAVAHLAGTLGVPTWILLYTLLDWRWGLTGSKTEWYPTAKLFRQTASADWTEVMGEVESSLRALLASQA